MPCKNHHKLVRNRQNRVDITKHRWKDIGLPVLGWGSQTDKLPEAGVHRNYPKPTLHHCQSNEMDILAGVPSPAFQKRQGHSAIHNNSAALNSTNNPQTNLTSCRESSHAIFANSCLVQHYPIHSHPTAKGSKRTNFHIKQGT